MRILGEKTTPKSDDGVRSSRLLFFLVVTATFLLMMKVASLQIQIGKLEAITAAATATKTNTNANNNNNNNNIHNNDKKWQPKTSAYTCPKVHDIPANVFKSQFQEDKTLMHFFGKICNGRYMEMGALDGIKFSNSHAFYAGGLGWKGFLLEASPKHFQNLRINRPNDLALVNAGVCRQERDLHFVEGKFASTGGFLEFAGEEHKKNFFTPQAIENAQIVKCKPLGDLIQQYMGEYIHFDFYSLDIEGAEYGALQTIDFEKVSFGIIFVEASGDNPIKDTAVKTLLESKGYRHLQYDEILPKGHRYPSNWFINKDWHSIYDNVIYNNNG